MPLPWTALIQVAPPGKSDPFTVNVDLTAPTATASLVSITQDTGSSGSDFVTSDNTLVFNL
ncbi:hypothetical protein ACW7EJ_05155, partial [Acinetobacter soli]